MNNKKKKTKKTRKNRKQNANIIYNIFTIL